MLPDVINKVVFDLHCKDEATAEKLGQDIIHSSWDRINQILATVLEKYSHSPYYFRFDKMEIDLGTVSFSGANEEELLLKFQYMFEERLNQLSRQEEKLNPEKINWEMLMTWLIRGELPWWTADGNTPDIKHLLNHFIKKDPVRVNHFLEQHTNNAVVMQRLMPMRKDLAALLPATSSFFTELPLLINPGSLSSGIIQQMQQYLVKDDNDEINATQYLIQYLSLSNTISWVSLPNKQQLNARERKVLALLNQFTNDNREKIARSLTKISISKWGSWLFENANNNSPDETPVAGPKVSRALSGLFKLWKTKEQQRRKMISTIIRHPYLFRYDILGLLLQDASIFIARDRNSLQKQSLRKFREAWNKTGKELKRSLKSLPDEERQSYGTMVYSRYADTKAELTILRKILEGVSNKGLNLISFLTGLEEHTIQELSVKPEDNTTRPRQILVANAGLCLLANYLPALFKNLGYLENNNFKNRKQIIKALYLLEYMVYGKKTNHEYRLQLNKLLCGLTAQEVLASTPRLSKKDCEEADELLQAVINNWNSLKNTSLQGFRTSFLQRNALLLEEEKAWTMRVEKKGIDILLDSIQWSYNIIRLPWMQKMITVEW